MNNLQQLKHSKFKLEFKSASKFKSEQPTELSDVKLLAVFFEKNFL